MSEQSALTSVHSRSGSKKAVIRQMAADLLAQSPPGLRFTVLARRIRESLPEVREGTIRWGIHTLLSEPRPDVYRSKAGFYKASKYWRPDDG